MNTPINPLHHWNYLISLEKDLKQMADYIEFNISDHEKVYSINLLKFLLSACAEIETLAIRLDKISSGKSSIYERFRQIEASENSFVNLCKMKVVYTSFEYECEPLTQIAETKKEDDIHLNFWKAYNAQKHSRPEKFNQANLKNALDAFAALFLLNCFYYAKELRGNDSKTVPKPWPTIVTLEPQYLYSNAMNFGWNVDLNQYVKLEGLRTKGQNR